MSCDVKCDYDIISSDHSSSFWSTWSPNLVIAGLGEMKTHKIFLMSGDMAHAYDVIITWSPFDECYILVYLLTRYGPCRSKKWIYTSFIDVTWYVTCLWYNIFWSHKYILINFLTEYGPRRSSGSGDIWLSMTSPAKSLWCSSQWPLRHLSVYRAQQTMWQELIQTDGEGRNVRSDSLMVDLSLWEGFLSVLKGTSYSRDREH